MPFCPKCGTEYRKGFSNCVDCKVELVESLDNKKGNLEKPHWVHLITAHDEIEANVILGLLDANGIRGIKRYSGFSEYLKVYMGTAFNVKILVPDNVLKNAKNILTISEDV
ncbi:MAG TPA: DUF2007 domain-containing protein [Thermoanaerobacterales bacterium]|nr:DUF2007 domain-containing protein [Thermoanaerobacterales bacterium]